MEKYFENKKGMVALAVIAFIVVSGVYLNRSGISRLAKFGNKTPENRQSIVNNNPDISSTSASDKAVENQNSGAESSGSVVSVPVPAPTPTPIPTPAPTPTPAPASTTEKLPQSALISGVPFTAQAPFGDWQDPKEQHGCEEASLTMAAYWISGKALTGDVALREIIAISDFEQAKYGNYYDTSSADTLKLLEDYYGFKNAQVRSGITADDIKSELAKGSLVVMAIDGTKLGNPHYTPPGPERHQLVVIGYDDVKKQFVTNDPGTRYGKAYRYDYDVFMAAVRDYKTGFDVPFDGVVKTMIVIGKKQG
jgi:hypothetical protein